jgi:CTP synthase (UTP-ammonia lyase)
MFCSVSEKNVIQNVDSDTLYSVPLALEEEGLPEKVCDFFKLPCGAPDLDRWKEIVEIEKSLTSKVDIALVGKYVELRDAYLSVAEALKHAGISNKVQVEIHWLHSEKINRGNVDELLSGMNGILVPGGFGSRGIEGKIAAIEFARTRNIPYFGICLGMQMSVVEFARNVLGMEDAHSSELDGLTTVPVIDLMQDQYDLDELGGTMRLGLYPCKLMVNPLFMNAIVTDMSSITPIEVSLKPKALCFQVFRRMSAWWKSLNFQTILGLLPHSFIRSSNQGPHMHIRFSMPLFQQPWRTVFSGIGRGHISKKCFFENPPITGVEPSIQAKVK